MVTILDGSAAAAAVEQDLSARIAAKGGVPGLAIIQVGDDPRSDVYIKRKLTVGARIGARVEHVKLPLLISSAELNSKIDELNARQDIHGIIVQMPLPDAIDPIALINRIDPKKDVDGLGAYSAQRLLASARHAKGDVVGHIPATARGISTLLKANAISLSGKKVVVLGRSMIAGLSAALVALAEDATITVCHSQTPDVASIIKQADVLITATGKPRSITASMVSPHLVIVDVGISSVEEGKIAGDTDFDTVAPTVAAISPVPKGVGPMTVISLYQNLCDAFDA